MLINYLPIGGLVFLIIKEASDYVDTECWWAVIVECQNIFKTWGCSDENERKGGEREKASVFWSCLETFHNFWNGPWYIKKNKIEPSMFHKRKTIVSENVIERR